MMMPEPGAQRRPKVLIVDDNQVVLLALSRKLTAGGYEVLTALDGAGAIRGLRQGQPDLVLLDIQFPPEVAQGGGVGWNGFSLLQWFRRVDEGRNTPVIMMTTGDPAVFRKKALQAGASDFLAKPIAPQTLLNAVADLVGRGAETEMVNARTPAVERPVESGMSLAQSAVERLSSLFNGLPVQLEAVEG